MFDVRKLGGKLAAWSAIAVVVASVVLPAAVQAQATTTRPPLSLTTSPIPLSIVTTPGKTVTADLRVKNNNTQPEKLKIELLKFGASGDNGTPQLHEREAKDSYFDWVSFSEPTFTAEPNVWKTIKMTIKTPPSAAFGYYIAVLFSRASPDKPTGGASAVEGGVASLVLLDVEAPGASRQAKVVSLTADQKVYEFLPANLNIRLHNAGNVHVSPSGSIFIKRGDTQVAVLDFNTAQGNILPGTDRVFKSSWNDGFPYFDVKQEGNKTTKTLRWDFSKLQKFRFGHYTATLVAVYDNGQRDVPIEATVGFWVIPWRILGVALLIVLLVLFGIWMILRSIGRKLTRRPKQKPTDTPDDSPPTDSGTTVADPDPDETNSKPDKPEKPEQAPSTANATTAPLLPKKSASTTPKSASSSDSTDTAPELKG